MDAYRFPIGTFEPTRNPTQEQRSVWMEDIAELPKLLRQTVQHLTTEQLLTPYRPGGWTVRQVVHHMADNDMNAFIRFKRALTEDSPTAGTYREDLFAELSDYRSPVDNSLILMDALRKRFTVLLRSLQPSDFQKTFISPTHGMMTLDVAAERFAWHGRHHLEQIVSLKTRMGWKQ